MAPRFLPGYKAEDTLGVLLVNLGTPDEATPRAVRRYLREFLWDPRMVEIPRMLWWLILHLVILPLRPRRSARAYSRIWTQSGSPLMANSLALGEALGRHLQGDSVVVTTAMRYGSPSVAQGLSRLREARVGRLLVLPLYPQYSSTSTATVYDAVSAELRRWRFVPPTFFLGDYHAHPAYINAVAASIAAQRKAHGDSGFLLFSFHGLPEASRQAGDPYYDQCLCSASLIAQALGLAASQWDVAFQSRFGRAEWLKPYCVEVLADLPKRGVSAVDVVCPGFVVDCLETLDEIAYENRQVFMAAGGKSYRYLSALNADQSHVLLLTKLLRPCLSEQGIT